jgi:hypothetical protein
MLAMCTVELIILVSQSWVQPKKRKKYFRRRITYLISSLNNPLNKQPALAAALNMGCLGFRV